MTAPRIVIVGAGHAAGTAAELLRRYAHNGTIVMIGDEPIPPYQRPPLSKAWLKGEADAESLALRPLAFYREHDIDFRPDMRVVAIDRAKRRVELADGQGVAYDVLILATGARPLMLPVPGNTLGGIQPLRNAADADALKRRIGPGHRLAIIGGGYIGLEVAASARALGAEVVVIEREARLLARVACDALSSFFQSYHQKRGVTFELGCTVTRFEGQDDRVIALHLSDNRRITCDSVVVGIGARPCDELAAACGLETTDGVLVDAESRSLSDPRIFAIGDVARRPMPIYDRMFRLESVPNAIEQAKQAASAITGRPRPADECPWQWSDQYELKLQIAGYPFDADQVVVRGNPATESFAVFHLKADRLQAVEAINLPAAFMMGRQRILDRGRISTEKLADLALPIREAFA